MCILYKTVHSDCISIKISQIQFRILFAWNFSDGLAGSFCGHNFDSFNTFAFFLHFSNVCSPTFQHFRQIRVKDICALVFPKLIYFLVISVWKNKCHRRCDMWKYKGMHMKWRKSGYAIPIAHLYISSCYVNECHRRYKSPYMNTYTRATTYYEGSIYDKEKNTNEQTTHRNTAPF